jgi:hypothetical protein
VDLAQQPSRVVGLATNPSAPTRFAQKRVARLRLDGEEQHLDAAQRGVFFDCTQIW